MQGHFAQAIAHIQSGCKILCEMEYDEQTREHHHDVLVSSKFPYVPIQTLEELFLRLDFSVVEVSYAYLYFPDFISPKILMTADGRRTDVQSVRVSSQESN
jgi:hypothetical protein